MKNLKICLVILCLSPFRVVGLPQFVGATFFMKEIVLTHGLVASVDDEDFDRINAFKWHSQKIGNVIYACRSQKRKNSRISDRIYMHRLVMNVNDRTLYVDHRNHNGLNNQKYNLRISTPSQNITNCRKQQNTTSKHFGVCFYPKRNKYMSYISVNKKRIYLGWHITEESAALAYNKKAIELHGEFAKINKI